MGIGWTPAYRADIVGDAFVGDGTTKSDATAFVFDGPAACRRLTATFPGNNGGARSARGIAKCLAKQVRRHTADGTLAGKVVSVYFDNLHKLPAQRALVAASRARAHNPITAEEKEAVSELKLDALGPGHLTMVMPWDLLLRDKDTKAIVWELLGQALFAVFCEEEGCSVEVVTEKKRYVRQYDDVLPPTTQSAHGEADLMVRERSTELADAGQTVEIVTVDYDQLLQSLLERRTGARYVRYPKELIDVHILREKYGTTRGRLLTAAFHLLAAFKSDYSKSLCRPAKMKVKEFITEMQACKGNIVSEVVDVAGTHCLVFKPQQLRGILKRPNAAVAKLVGSILWTLAYFAEYERTKRQPTIAYPDDDVWFHDSITFAHDV